MNTSLNLALRYLKSQKRRNLLTVFSVVMAVALFASTGILITSFQNMVKETHIQTRGDWHYKIYTPAESNEKISLESALKVPDNMLVEEAGVAAEDNYLKIGLIEGKNENEATSNDYNFYNLKEYDSAVLSMFPYANRIIEGRMPENENELIISNGSASFWKGSKPLGSEVTFDIGTGLEYVDDEYTNFEFNKTGTRTFKIVGIYERFRFSRMFNISEALTINPSGDHAFSTYVKVKSVLNYKKSIDQVMKDLKFNTYAYYDSNDGFLRWIGQGNDKIRFMFLVVFAILCAIILVAMTMVIKNSFALSYSEKITQLGILRCIGATKKQIRNIVLAEGIVIWAIAQPLGILVALLSMRLVILVVSGIELDMLNNLRWVTSYWPIGAAMFSSLITILISAWLPAKKASKISPVEAVRGNMIVDGNNNRIGIISKISEPIFGFSWSLASRNIKRHKSRYRATVISVIVSVVLFISVVGLSMGLNYSLQNYGGGNSAEFFLNSNHHFPKTEKNYLDIVRVLDQYDEIEYTQSVYPLRFMINVPKNRVPNDYEETFRKYYSIDTPYVYDDKYMKLGNNLKEIDIIPVSRKNYETLRFKGSTPDYDYLIKSKEVLFSQTETFRKNGSMSVIEFSDFKTGDELSIGRVYNDELTELKKVRVAGELSEPPWYVKRRSQGYIVVPEENISMYLSPAEDIENSLYTKGNVAIKAKKNTPEGLSKKLEKATKSSFGAYNGFLLNSPYEKSKKLKDIILVMNIFIYGFITVIVIICSLNIFNTIATNLSNRKREVAMLRAVGMSIQQLWKNLFLECLIYAIKGTIYGGITGLAFQYLIINIMNRFLAIDYQSPLIYLLLSLVFSTIIAVIAGTLPINRMLKSNLADALREAD
ncbi:FtsX-like permease family protein [Wukongibacter baidiensis]|uniref:ABC transporter permease n=1 Tax=Wukongibacter baidiensis TaxID=1723361 RepID=UPI003D7FB4D9